MFSKKHVRQRPARRKRGSRWNHCLITALCAAVFLVWNFSRLPTNTVIDVSSSGPNENRSKNDDSTKYILYYTPFWNHKDYRFGFGQAPFQTCPSHTNCYATDNRQYLNSMGDFDAVLFHSINFDYDQEVTSIQKWRTPHQRFVYFNAESPQTYASPNAPGFYNWTVTYRHESDIVRPYGWFEQRSHFRMYPPPLQTTEWPVVYKEEDFGKQDLAPLLHLAKRPEKVAWIVSNCNTASRRDDYARELSKYIPVDVFGKCGTKPCDMSYATAQNKLDNCTLAVEKEYKFYLSFENTLCKDYVTEKFFSRVNQFVAIVMGGANYSQLAPPHSYISVMDYASPKELAEYLLELDRNDTLYLSYFWWKQHYTSNYRPRDMQALSFCQLCDKLHSQKEPTKSYASLHDWWSTGSHCGELRVPGMSSSPLLRVDWKNG